MRISISMLVLVLFLALPATAPALGDRPQTAEVKIGGSAPDFTLQDLQGKSTSLSEQRGKVVFLNFWATWCPPCREELPAMQRLNEVFGSRNFVILAVNVEDNLPAVKKFLTESPLSFRVLLDPQAKAQNLYGVYRFPETFLIDKEGRVLQHYIGARDWSSVEFLKYISSLTGE